MITQLLIIVQKMKSYIAQKSYQKSYLFAKSDAYILVRDDIKNEKEKGKDEKNAEKQAIQSIYITTY